jgi:hypothetical protein
VTCLYDNAQFFFKVSPAALNAQCPNGCSPADSYQELQYYSARAEQTSANKRRGAERYTYVVTQASNLQTHYQCQERELQLTMGRWQLAAAQTGFGSIACRAGGVE